MAITPEEAKENYTKYVLEKYNKCEIAIDNYLSDRYYLIAKNGQIKITEKSINHKAGWGPYAFDVSWADPVIQAILKKFKGWSPSHSEGNEEFTFYLEEVERTVVKTVNVYQFLDLGEEIGKKTAPKKVKYKKVNPNFDPEDDDEDKDDFSW